MGHEESLRGAAILFGDPGLEADLHQLACQVARARGVERAVHKPLAGTGGGDKELPALQAFQEIATHRNGDDVTGRVRHEAADARQLADLLEFRFGRTGLDNRRQTPPRVERSFELGADRFGGTRPDLNYLPVLLLFSDHPSAVRLLDCFGLSVCCRQDLVLFGWHLDVGDGKADATARRVMKPERFQPVGHLSGDMWATGLQALNHEQLEVLFGHGVVLEAELLWKSIIEKKAASGRLNPLMLWPRRSTSRCLVDGLIGNAHEYARVQINHVGIERKQDLACVREDAARTLPTWTVLCEIKQPQDHVLRERDGRVPRSRRA